MTLDRERADRGRSSPTADRVSRGDAIVRVSGNARALLAAERVALNFLGHLCGIATLTRAYVG